jgi:hypothetical protein
LLPSTAIILDDGTPIAWSFLGPDSSLSSLHCEECYRGQGLAKAVAVRLLRGHLPDFGDEGYGWADVSQDNGSSQGVCRSLGGRIGWTVSWYVFRVVLSGGGGINSNQVHGRSRPDFSRYMRLKTTTCSPINSSLGKSADFLKIEFEAIGLDEGSDTWASVRTIKRRGPGKPVSC